ncbi:MAG TPA: hypothetical protein VIM79_19145 [Niastella sp.]
MRNKLKIKSTYFIAALVVILAGCQPKEHTEQLKAINESLEKSNGFIKDAASRRLMEMEDKTHQPIYKAKADIWFSVMKKVEATTDTLIEVIEKLKGEAGNQTDALKLDNVSVLSLLNKLASFKDNIPAYFNIIDSIESPPLYKYLRKDCKNIRKLCPLLPDYAEGLNTEQRSAYINKWFDNNLHGSSALMTIVLLNKLKNDLLYTRSVLMDHCSLMVGACDGPGSYSVYHAIAVLNSTYVKRGQTIEVIAGMGGFSFARRPRVTIAGNEVKLDDNAKAVHRFKADGKPGKHNLTVKIEFTNDLGAQEYMSQNLEYEIADLK